MASVSVIIPFYKKHLFLKKAIESILSQTYKDFEIIIIHDDPKDQNLEFISNIKSMDNRIIVLKNKENLGAGFSRNEGIKIAKGNYIAFLDADDVWYQNKLSVQIDFMKKNNCEFSHTSYEILDLNEKIISKRIAKEKLDYEQLIKSCDIGLSSVILKKEILRDHKFPSLKTKEDYVLWLLLAKSGIKIYAISEVLMKWRRTNNSLSDNTFQKITDGFKVYNSYLNYNLLLSLKCLFILSLNYILKKIKS